ncbi:MAG: diguanylate cyclase [Actinomycetota bacterium]|nr:diguanylate cyclase [Actinomycetota bacterium]
MSEDEGLFGLEMLRRLHVVIRRLNGNDGLTATLQAVADGVVHAVDFEVAVVSLMHAGGMLETVAVAGDEQARRLLLGRMTPLGELEKEFALAEHWGSLLFVPHDRVSAETAVGWIPDIPVPDSPDAWHPLDALFAPLRNRDGDLVGLVSVDLPGDRRRPGQMQREMLEMFASHAGLALSNSRVTEQLRASEEAFRVAFEGAGSGMAVVSLSPEGAGRYHRVNPALCRLLGYEPDDLLRLSPDDITHPDDVLAGAPDLSGVLVDGRAASHTLRYVRRDGSTLWVAVTSNVVDNAAGSPSYAINVVEDVSARHDAEAELHRRAHHDPLTGLLNRHAMAQVLRAAVERAHTSHQPGMVIFCDLDGFKRVNDEHGHDIGDKVLVVVAERIAQVLRANDTAMRIGGDEFLVVADALPVHEQAVLTSRLVDNVTAPIHLGGITVRIGLSVGVQPITTDGDTDPQAIVRAADLAMYDMKRSSHAATARGAPDGSRPGHEVEGVKTSAITLGESPVRFPSSQTR